jgi:hypothetical protein
MRENSGAYSFAFSLPAMMRQSDHAPIEILPELLVEFGLIADRLKAGGVGAQPAHDAVVCVSADAAAKRLGAERSDPLGKIAGSARDEPAAKAAAAASASPRASRRLGLATRTRR